jgi:hypothetical protein
VYVRSVKENRTDDESFNGADIEKVHSKIED